MKEYIKKFNDFLNESFDGKELIVEMATMNRKDTNGVLPDNLAHIELRSNDHTPPHIHIVWEGGKKDVKYLLETGDYLNLKDNEQDKGNPSQPFFSLIIHARSTPLGLT